MRDIHLFVPYADIIELKSANVSGAEQPFDSINRGGVSERRCAAFTEPPWESPVQCVQRHVRVPLFRFGDNFPFVSAIVVLVVGRMHMGRLSALIGLRVAADLHFEYLQRRGKSGIEKFLEVVDLGQLFF